MRRKPLNQLKLKLITKSKTVCRDPRGLCIKQLLWTVCWFPPFPRLIFFSQGLDGLCVELEHPLNVVLIATSSHSIADAQLKARTPHSDCYLNFVVLGCGTLLLCYLNTAFLWRRPSSPSSIFPLLPWSQQIGESISCLYYAVGNSEPHRWNGTSVTRGKQSSASQDLTLFLLVR